MLPRSERRGEAGGRGSDGGTQQKTKLPNLPHETRLNVRSSSPQFHRPPTPTHAITVWPSAAGSRRRRRKHAQEEPLLHVTALWRQDRFQPGSGTPPLTERPARMEAGSAGMPRFKSSAALQKLHADLVESLRIFSCFKRSS